MDKLTKVVIVFGSDETVFDVSQKMTSTQTLISHNHKISIAVVNSDPTQAAGLAAIDIHKFDQMGCLSPHCIMLIQGKNQDLLLLALQEVLIH